MHPREGWSEGRDPAPSDPLEGQRSPVVSCWRRAPGSRSAACWPAAASTNPAGASSGDPPLPRQDSPVKWPIYSDNKPIASGLAPEEGATLQLYNWVAYINEAVIKSFCKKYNCNYSLTTYNTMEEALAKLASGQLKFDVFFPTVAVLGQLVAAKMIRPLNHSYIPNMANAWPDYRNPFYDQGWQYTTPYSIYTTGMAWRKDKVNLAPSWNMPWQGAPYKGKVAVLDDYRETISLALLRAGNLDLNTTSTPQIHAAGKALSQLAALTNVRIDNNDYTDVPTGKTWIHHAWSGDMAAAYEYLPKGTSIDTLGYWFPAEQEGSGRQRPDGESDQRLQPRARSPVHRLHARRATTRSRTTATSVTCSRLTEVTPAKLISEKLLPPQLTSTVVLPDYFRHGLFQLELPAAANAVWESTWNSFSKGL